MAKRVIKPIEYGRAVPPLTCGGGVASAIFPTSIPITVTGYTCMACGTVVLSGDTHVCPSTYDPFSYIYTPKTTAAKSPTMKHINWQEYKPAVPPPKGSDYLIVFICMKTGNKDSCRGSFDIVDHRDKWLDEDGKEIGATVTHYAKLELP